MSNRCANFNVQPEVTLESGSEADIENMQAHPSRGLDTMITFYLHPQVTSLLLIMMSDLQRPSGLALL